jgi:hypothetical protein
MATSRKKTAKKKTTAKRRPAAKKKTTKKNAAKKVLKWGKGVVHPVTKRPCGGRAMSQRDQKLFTRMGKRRAGVTPTKVREAYGLKKPARQPAKKKAVAKRPARKAATKRKPARKAAPKKRTMAAKKKAPKGYREKKVSPGRSRFKYVIFDASGRDHYGCNKLTDARRKLKELKAEKPKAKLQIYEMKG